MHWGVLGLVALAAAWNALGYWHQSIDDAYISLTYAGNLVAGNGLVYNPGEHVEGFSNPPWVLGMALGLLLGLPHLVGAKLLGLVSHVLTVVAAGGLALHLARPQGLAGRLAAVLGVGFLAVSVPANWWALMGLETTSYAALMMLAYWRLAVEADAPAARPWSAALGALAALSRPEAPIAMVALVAARLLLGWRRGEWRSAGTWLGIFAVPTVGYLLFRLAYFGYPLPNTFYKKAAPGTWDTLSDYVQPWAEGEWMFLVLGLGGLGALAVTRWRRAWPVLAGTAGMALFVVWVGYDWMPNQRFVTPMLPALAMGVGAGAALLAERLPASVRWVPLAVVALALGLQAKWSLPVERNLRTKDGVEVRARADDMYAPASFSQPWPGLSIVPTWIVERAPAGSTVAFTDIGMLGWATDYTVIDLAGLTDEVWSGATGLDYPGMAADLGTRLPDWIILKKGPMTRFKAIAGSPWLTEHYELVAGPRNTLAARRKDVPYATPEQIADHYRFVVERAPRDERLLWRAVNWLHATGDDAAVSELCAAMKARFPTRVERNEACDKLMGRKARRSPKVEDAPLPAALGRFVPGWVAEEAEAAPPSPDAGGAADEAEDLPPDEGGAADEAPDDDAP